MPPLISGGDQFREGVYNLEQFVFVSKKVIFFCLAGNCGVIYGSDVKVTGNSMSMMVMLCIEARGACDQYYSMT